MYIKLTSLLFIVTAPFSVANNISIYKWVDENNVIHFSQNHPTTVDSTQVTVEVAYQASPNDLALIEKQDEISQLQKRLATQTSVNSKIMQENCKTAKINLKILDNFDKILTTNNQGEKKVLSPEEKTQQLVLTKKHLNVYCLEEKS